MADGYYGFWSAIFVFGLSHKSVQRSGHTAPFDLLPRQSCCDQSDLYSSQITTVVIKTYHKVQMSVSLYYLKGLDIPATRTRVWGITSGTTPIFKMSMFYCIFTSCH